MGGLSSSQWRCSELLFCSWQTLSQSPTLLSIHKFPVLCDEVNLPGRRWACWRYCFIFANVGLSDEVWKNSGTFGCLLNLGDFCREEKKNLLFFHNFILAWKCTNNSSMFFWVSCEVHLLSFYGTHLGERPQYKQQSGEGKMPKKWKANQWLSPLSE